MQPLFDDDDDGAKGIAKQGADYALQIPMEFPSKFEEQHIVKSMIDSMTANGVTPLAGYIAFKQMERMSKTGTEQLKDRASEYVRANMITQYAGTKVSMRGSFGGYIYDPDVEAVRIQLQKEIDEISNRLAVVESEAKRAGKAKKVPGKPGLAVTFREI